jgi:hypothetical protein
MRRNGHVGGRKRMCRVPGTPPPKEGWGPTIPMPSTN